MRTDKFLRSPRFGILLLSMAVLIPAGIFAEEPSEKALSDEIRYIDALSTQGYVDFAPEVIDAAKRKWPNAGGVLEAVTIRAELNGGKQNEVKAKIDARPDKNSMDTWLLRLELAQSYYRYSKYQDAEKIYAEFFSKFKQVAPAVRESYTRAAYTYVQMLKQIGRPADTLLIYAGAIEQSPNAAIARDLQAEYLMVLLLQAEGKPASKERDDLISKAEALAKKMVWVQDGVFGDAINGMAHAKMLRGDVKGAQEMIKEYLPDLMNIHNSYKEKDPDGSQGILRMSPLPACRYLIGKMLFDESKKEIDKGGAANEETIKNLLLGERDAKTKKRNGQGAFNHLINVFVGYPECQHASAAGDLVEKIQDIIFKRYGSRLTVNVSNEQREKVRQQQYVEANVKFDQGNWAGAAEAFSKTISQYGINAQAIPAMRKMVECYIREGGKSGKMDPMAQFYADTVTAALAEGCSGVPALQKDAGNTLRQIANFYSESKLKRPEEDTLDLFFRYYPKHPDATLLQLKIAQDCSETNPERSEKLFQKVIASATGSDQRQTRESALFLLLKFYQPKGGMADPVKEMKAAKDFVAHYDGIKRPGSMAAIAMFYQAEAYLHQADKLRQEAKDAESDKQQISALYALAVKTYASLVKELEKPTNIYQSTASERQQNAQLLENSMYQQGTCMQRLPATGNAKRDKNIKAAAEKYFNNYLAKYPKGVRAPAALLQIGTLQTADGDVEGSRISLAKLRKEFPNSDEAKNSIPLLADSLFKMGMKGEGIATYKQMFAAGGDYTAAQYSAAAEKLLESGENKLAIEACDKVLNSKGAQGYIPTTMLLRSRALLLDKQVTAAYKQVLALLEKYGNTTVAIDANLELIRIAGAEILEVKTYDERNDLIGKVKKSVQFVTAQRPDDVAIAAELNLAVADVLEKKYRSEAETKDERANDSLGVAINAYDRALSVGTTDPTDSAVATYVQKAYFGLIRLQQAFAAAAPAAEQKDVYADIIKAGTTYLDLFPKGTYVTEITNAMTQAKIQAGE